MFCPNCGNEVPDDSSFCPKCGKEIKTGNVDNKGSQQGASAVSNIQLPKNLDVSKIVKIAIPVLAVLIIILGIRSCGGSKAGDSKDGLPTNFKKYYGTWSKTTDVGGPDIYEEMFGTYGGTLKSTGYDIEFDEHGINLDDLFGLRNNWCYMEDIKYYNDDGNDYYVVFTGDPMGFYYDKKEKRMVMTTPDQENPSNDPYTWHDRFYFKQK